MVTYLEIPGISAVPWMPGLGVSYYLGIDGISLFLVLLTTFLTPSPGIQGMCSTNCISAVPDWK